MTEVPSGQTDLQAVAHDLADHQTLDAALRPGAGFAGGDDGLDRRGDDRYGRLTLAGIIVQAITHSVCAGAFIGIRVVGRAVRDIPRQAGPARLGGVGDHLAGRDGVGQRGLEDDDAGLPRLELAAGGAQVCALNYRSGSAGVATVQVPRISELGT